MTGVSKPDFAQDIPMPHEVEEIVRRVAAEGGKALLVGGMVRDRALGLDAKDLDIEIHRLELDRLEALLGHFGKVDLVGKQFGVLRVHGIDADFSVPRKDSRGRHPEVAPDPFMGIEEAARRRDLTINAMAIDTLEGKLYDPFDGMKDMKQRRLRAPDANRFPEDPLRFFRVMGFIGRFEMDPDEELDALCKAMDLTGVARERIEEEFNRLWLRSRRPSLGLRWLEAISRLEEVLPEAAALVGLDQDPGWHPEGDAWQHTLQVVDAAAGLKMGDREQDLMLLWAALCHDLGKAETTIEEDGRIKSPGHTEVSARMAENLLGRYVGNQKVLEGAVKLSEHHLKPHDFYVNKAGSKAFKRLALVLSPETTLERLAAMALADTRGRNPDGDEPQEIASEKCDWFLEMARQLKVEREPEPPVLKGRHLLDVIKPGPEMGRLLRKAYEIQLGEDIRDKDVLRARVLDEKED
jgi:tRNA nucleotidyltransferase (CCA-adding enzyme)